MNMRLEHSLDAGPARRAKPTTRFARESVLSPSAAFGRPADSPHLGPPHLLLQHDMGRDGDCVRSACACGSSAVRCLSSWLDPTVAWDLPRAVLFAPSPGAADLQRHHVAPVKDPLRIELLDSPDAGAADRTGFAVLRRRS